MTNRRPSRGNRYAVKCPRCVIQARREKHDIKLFWSYELEAHFKSEGFGAIFNCPRCQLAVKISPSKVKGQPLTLEKPDRRSSTDCHRRSSSKINRRTLHEVQDDDSTREMTPGERVDHDAVEVELVGDGDYDDTMPSNSETIDLYDAKTIFSKNLLQIKTLIESKTTLMGYRLFGEVLGQGGEAIVASAAKEDKPESVVVLKFQYMTIGDGEEGKITRDRVRRTFALQQTVTSAYAARAIDLIVHPYGLILVEEYVHGIPLNQVLNEGSPISESWAIELGMQILDALNIAWERARIVHRDIKPANIMIRQEEGHLNGVLTDFGICRSNAKDARDSFGVFEDDFAQLDLDQAIETLTNGEIRGTPKYMAPEQIDGRRVDARTDIYSLGATLYHSVTGRPPISGHLISDILKGVMYQTPVDPSAVKLTDRDPISKPFAKFLMKCLEKEPSHRYQTPQEAIDALIELSRNSSEDPMHKPASGITDIILGFFRK